jgi:hypothetical protein
MRYITIPESVVLQATDKNGNPVTVNYSFANLLAEIVWPHEAWHDGSIDNADMFPVLYKKFLGKQTGEIVELTDAEYEKFAPIATKRGEKLNPAVAFEMNTLMRCIITAKREIS